MRTRATNSAWASVGKAMTKASSKHVERRRSIMISYATVSNPFSQSFLNFHTASGFLRIENIVTEDLARVRRSLTTLPRTRALDVPEQRGSYSRTHLLG